MILVPQYTNYPSESPEKGTREISLVKNSPGAYQGTPISSMMPTTDFQAEKKTNHFFKAANLEESNIGTWTWGALIGNLLATLCKYSICEILKYCITFYPFTLLIKHMVLVAQLC